MFAPFNTELIAYPSYDRCEFFKAVFAGLHHPPITMSLVQKRIQALSEPAKPTVARKFATDEDERHCRFQPKRKGGTKATADDDSEVDSKANDFIGRMEAAEKSRQKVSRVD